MIAQSKNNGRFLSNINPILPFAIMTISKGLLSFDLEVNMNAARFFIETLFKIFHSCSKYFPFSLLKISSCVIPPAFKVVKELYRVTQKKW